MRERSSFENAAEIRSTLCAGTSTRCQVVPSGHFLRKWSRLLEGVTSDNAGAYDNCSYTCPKLVLSPFALNLVTRFTGARGNHGLQTRRSYLLGDVDRQAAMEGVAKRVRRGLNWLGLPAEQAGRSLHLLSLLRPEEHPVVSDALCVRRLSMLHPMRPPFDFQSAFSFIELCLTGYVLLRI